MSIFLQSIRKFVRPFRTLLVEYCDNSNIHGVRYLTEKFLHWSERLWWIIALIASLGLCGFAALNIWTEWRDNPVTFSYTEPSILITEIPFPTVTICPQIKTETYQFDLTATLKSLSNLSEKHHIILNSMAHICPHLSKKIDLKDNFAHEKIHHILHNIAPPYENTFTASTISYASVVPVFTGEGLCFTYNALNSHDIYTDDMAPEMMIVKDNNRNASNWSLEKDIQNKSTAERYPIHEFRIAPLKVFSAGLRAWKKDLEYQCRASEQGFKLFFNAPGDAIKFSGNFYRVRLGEIMRVIIKPTLTITSDGLRKYNPQQRQCFFDSERRLRFFKIYSKSNCEAECLANFTQGECGCVKFSQPRDRHTKMCGGAKINCYKMAEEILSSGDSSTKSFRDKCNCLPSCTSIEYEIDIDRMKINMENWKKIFFPSKNSSFKIKPISLTYLSSIFDGEKVKVVKRIESYTFSDFLAFCGGLLGIFLGVSALSVVEIIYYSTLRLYFIIRPLEVSNAVVPFQQESSNIFERFRFIRGIRAFVVEFCDNSNIHGVVYFTRRGLHWIERLWWIISFGLSLWLCITMIISVLEGWQENPVKITFTGNERSISDIPFPTVTICPNIKFMRHKLDLNRFLSYPINFPNITRSINRSLRDNKNFRSVLHLCGNIQGHTKMDQTLSFPPNADENIYGIIQDIAPQFDDVIHKCIWQGDVVDCSMYMAPILTRHGLCFAFNALNSHEIYTDEMAPGMKIVKSNSNAANWSMESGYGNKTNQNDYPLRVYDSGRGAAFEISLDMFEKDFDVICYTEDQGFGVSFSVPGDELKGNRYLFRAALFEETVITVKPKLTTTSDGLRKYDPNHRKCFFDSERKLRFYKTYTQNNCEQECLANFTKKECGCVMFSQPRDEATPVCGVGKFLCYDNAKDHILLYLASDKEVERKHLESCNCLPSCTTIEYTLVRDSVQFNKSAIAVTAGRNANVSGIQRAKLVIYFEDRLIEMEQREELYTITDLFSICGGLLGLFMGISVLSVAEILYYSSLRWYWILRRPASQTN